MKNPILRLLLAIERKILKFKTKKDILLIVPNEIMYAYTKPIYDRLAGDRRIRPWFCFCSPHRFRKRNLAAIRKEKLRTIPVRIARHLKWDLILYPVHRRRFRADCKKIYIDHSMHMGKAANGESYKYGRHTRDKNNNLTYDKIFAASDHEKQLISKSHPQHYPTVKVVGSLLADSLLASVGRKEKILESLNFDAARKTIMIASSWGPHCFAQNLGPKFIENLPALLEKYNVIFSIHQCNFLRKCSPQIDFTAVIRNARYANCRISSNNAESIDLLLAADLLITDHTSLGLYYLLLGRPIIFYENANVEYTPGAMFFEFRKAAHVIHDIDSIKEDILQAFDEYDKEKIEFVASQACSHRNNAWQRYEHEIYEMLLLEPPSGTAI